jgi:anti-sigma factor RsiW
MAECDEIKLLLGPFTDGELEPNEMEEVALHVVGCLECKTALEDYRMLGVTLRRVSTLPALDGFAQAVQARIERIQVPLRLRITRYFDSLGERLGAGIALGVATAAIAVLTAVVLTPYARQLVNPPAPAPARIMAAAPQAKSPATTPRLALAPGDRQGAVSGNAATSELSKLEADSPSVALWNEPRTDTTVIWVPDQP